MLARSFFVVLFGLAACSDDAPEAPSLPTRGSDANADAPKPPSALAPIDEGAGARSESAPLVALEAGEVLVTVERPDGGAVAGIPVLGCDVDDAGAIEGRLRWGLAVPTDGRGHAVVPERRTGERYVAALFGEVPALSTATDPTRVVLPPTGSIRVVVDPADCPADVRFLALESEGRAIRLEVPAGGILDVPLVPLGRSYDLMIQTGETRTDVRIAGPREAGERVLVAPEIVREWTIRARVVDGNGSTYEGETVGLCSLTGQSLVDLERDGDVHRGRVTSDVWGAHEIALLAPPWKPNSQPRPYAVVSTLAPDATGTIDLGDVRLVPLPTIVAGRVVDAAGAPVPYAFVQARPRTPGERGAPWIPTYPMLTGNVGFGPLSYAVQETDADGRFELCAHPSEPWRPGDALDLRIRITERRDEFPRDVFREARAGDRDVRIIVAPKGDLAFDAAHLPEVVQDQVHVLLVRADGVGEPRALGKLQSGCGAQVEAGTYDAEFVLAGQPLIGPPPLVGRLRGIVVPAGEACSDARLAPLELPFDPIVRTVRIVDVEQRPIPRVELCYSAAPDGPWIEVDGLASDREGRLAWVDVPGCAVRAAVTSNTHGCVALTALTEAALIELPGLEDIEIVFEGAPPPRTAQLVLISPGLPRLSVRLSGDGPRVRARVQAGATYVLDTPGPWLGVEVEIPRDRTQVTVELPGGDALRSRASGE